MGLISFTIFLRRDPDSVLYFREWSGGILAGSFEKDPKPVFENGPPRSFEFSLFDDDWDHFDPHLEAILRRMPILEQAEVSFNYLGKDAKKKTAFFYTFF